jgi:hypothetical protein
VVVEPAAVLDTDALAELRETQPGTDPALVCHPREFQQNPQPGLVTEGSKRLLRRVDVLLFCLLRYDLCSDKTV